MVADVKKTKKKTPVILVIVLCIVVVLFAVRQWLFVGRGVDENAIAHVDGTIERKESEVTVAMNRMAEADPVPVITNRTSDTNRAAILLVGIGGDSEVNRQLLDILNEKGIRYSYALSAAEAIEDEDFAALLDESRVPIISNGALGEANLQNKDEEKMIQSLLKSHKVLNEVSKQIVPYVYCSASNVNAELLWAASVCGYEALIDPSKENVLDETAFVSMDEARTYVRGLSGDEIIILNLRGRNETPSDAIELDVALPAIDLPPSAEKETPEVKEDIPFTTQIAWLADALNEAQIETVHFSELEKTEGSEVLKQRMHSPDASKAVVYHFVLTDQKTVGFGLTCLSLQNSEAITAISASEIHPSIFVTPEEIKTEKETIPGMTNDFGILLPKSYEGVSEDELFTVIKTAMGDLSKLNDFNRVLLLEEGSSSELVETVRLLAKVLNLKVVMPNQKIEAGGLYTSDQWTETALKLVQEEAGVQSLTVRPLGTVVSSKLSIDRLSLAEENRLRKENNGQLSEETNLVLTTERTIGFAFYNLGSNTVIRDTTDRLKACGGNGTYFVTLDELLSRDNAIETILENGNELGIAYNPSDTYPETFDAVMNYLNTWQRYAQWRFGIRPNAVLMPNCSASPVTQEAIHAMNLSLIKATYLPVKDEDKKVVDISGICENLAKMRFMRGSFVCFNLGFYEADQNAMEGSTVAGQVLTAMIEEHVDSLAYRNYESNEIEDESRFTIQSVGKILASSEKYELNSNSQSVISMDKNVLESMNESEQFDYICTRYYGNVTVNTYEKLPGFNGSEIMRLDKEGNLTDEPVLFLTFDDWGTEETLNSILYILDKYNIKATFFVRTGYVDSNPNLLRAIASHGHLIAAHSDQHLALSDNVTSDGNLTSSISEEEAEVLREDLVTCYNKLYGIVGDYQFDGKDALAPFFRPPTLAVSRLGLYEVFDVGYEYSLSGGYSTGDYEASSFNDMVDRLTARSIGENQYIYVTNGTMVVMHMQENAKYTAQGLDYMIPLWQSKGFGFARVDDYLKP